MNVRCPNCSAVFPAAVGLGMDTQQVECPLCLLRFAPNAETTVSMPEMPAQLRGASQPSPDDEFESFGAPAGGSNTRALGSVGGPVGVRAFGQPTGESRTSTFPPAAPPVQVVRSAPAAAPFQPPSANRSVGDFEFDSSALDFDALLGDNPPAPKTQAESFVRSTTPRGDPGPTRGDPGAVEEEDIFATGPGATNPGTQSSYKAPTGLSFDDFGSSPAPLEPDVDADPFGTGSRHADAGDGGFGGFGGSLAPTAPVAQTPIADDDGFAGFAGLDATLTPARSPDRDSIIVPVGTASEAPTRAAQSRPQGRKASRFRVSADVLSWLQRLITALVLLGLVAALVGAGFEVLGFGWFGRRLWTKPDETAARAAASAKKYMAAQEPSAPLWDTRATYEAEIKRLEVLTKKSPKDPALAQQLLDRYLDLYERFPIRFADMPNYKTGMENALKLVQAPPRLEVIQTLASGTKLEEGKLQALLVGTPDDQAVAIRLMLVALERKATVDTLAKPGATGGGEVDAARLALRAMPEMAELRQKFAPTLAAAKSQVNYAKFQVLAALLADRAGAYGEILALVGPIIDKADDNAEARTLAASAHVELGNLDGADGLVRNAIDIADTQKVPKDKRSAWLVAARLAAKRGDKDKLVAALQNAVDLQPSDEMTVVRLARLLVTEKRGDDARKLLMAAKTSGMNSIAFEVALVEFWLFINRSEDALAELGEAGKLYPESVDLLFLRAQVEDKSAHFATARDLLAQVLQRDPKHLRAILRLAELQATAEKHDEALATLTAGRKALGDDESLLQLQVEELVALKREPEAREIAGRLLELAPENHAYLLRAAQLDLRLGEVDRGLGYLRKLRDMRMLDRDAAYQMGLALASKGKAEEGAQTVLPFAEQAQADVDLNVLAGKLLLDSKDPDRATTVLQRAVTAANGKSSAAFFQHGRLAFARGEVDQGISRMKSAIALDPSEWEYRLELARLLFGLKKPGAREVALEELNTIVGAQASYAKAGHPVKSLAEVHTLLARHFSEQHRYAQAAEHWRKVVQLAPDDIDALTSLGEALHQAASPDAIEVLKQVLKRRPGDARAALYVGKGELNHGNSSEAMHWFEVASTGTTPETAEAWYHIALIRRERGETFPALKAVDEYLKRAPKDATYRADALNLKAALKANAAH